MTSSRGAPAPGGRPAAGGAVSRAAGRGGQGDGEGGGPSPPVHCGAEATSAAGRGPTPAGGGPVHQLTRKVTRLPA